MGASRGARITSRLRRRGNTAGARSDFQSLTLGIDSSDDTRQRAQAAVELIDSGVAKSLPAAVKAAIAMPAPLALPAAQGPVQ